MNRLVLCIALLGLSLITNAKDYKASEIQSKQSFHYGRFETRFYSSDISGMLSTFFLFENDGWKDDEIWQEIDVEVFGKGNSNTWQSNYIYETDPAGPVIKEEGVHTIEGGSVADWHVYTVDWTSDYIEWFIDGVSVRKEIDQEVVDVIGAKPMLVMFNHWSSQWLDWTGPFEGTDIPSYQFVDYVKVYDWIEGTEFETEVSFEDGFDNGLANWNVSTHTFDGNIADFSRDNVGIKDGYLILAFTTEKATGYETKIPQDDVTGVFKSVTGKQGEGYPNPVTDLLNVEQLNNGNLIEVYSLEGKFIGEVSVVNNQVDLSQLEEGSYLLINKLEENDIDSKPWRQSIVKY